MTAFAGSNCRCVTLIFFSCRRRHTSCLSHWSSDVCSSELLWSGPAAQTTATATGLAAGTYTVTVTDANNCVKNGSVTITEPAALVVTLSQVNELCNGASTGSATASVTGGSIPYTYLWSDPAAQTTATATGFATRRSSELVTDANNCVKSGSVTITEPAALVVTLSQVNELCNGASTGSEIGRASCRGSAYTYVGGDPAAQTTGTATGLAAGT